jgi:hypothetical protein
LFSHEIRKYVAERDAQEELEAQHKHELAEIDAKLKHRDEPKNDGEVHVDVTVGERLTDGHLNFSG